MPAGMDADRGPAPDAHRHSWVSATVFLCLTLPVGAGIAVHWAGPLAGVVTVLAFPLPLLYAVPATRPWWARHRALLLTTQALLTYLPFVLFGGDWVVGTSGLLGALLLLTVATPMSWLLFGVAVAAESVLRFAVVGLPHLTGLSETPLVLVLPVYVGMALFGLVRLAGIVTELNTARTELATLTVARERLRAAERLRVAVGDRLDTVLAHARAALATGTRRSDEARERLDDAARSARQALDQIRAAVAYDRPASMSDPSADHTTQPTLAPRLARLVLALVLAALAAEFTVSAVASSASTVVMAASVAAIVLLAVLQLYHSTAWRDGLRPRGWSYTLTGQLLLTCLGFVPAMHPAIHGLSGFVAGSALLLLPRPWGWLTFTVIQASIAVHAHVLPDLDTADLVYALLVTVTTGLVVHALSRMAALAVELDDVRRHLARMAAVRERIRVAQDTHDLLGMGLSAVALKCDLARRLIGRDDVAARAELQALTRLARQARADLRSVTADERVLSLSVELAAAAEVLAAAGVDAVVRAEPSVARLPEQLDTVLATLLREAVTNVVRHAPARGCEITVEVGGDTVRLRVTNDGLPGTAGERGQLRPPGPDAPPDTGGHGLSNLAGRVADLAGRLSVRVHGGRFELTAWLPLPGVPPRQRGERAPVVGDSAHRPPVVGGSVPEPET
ncbi:histidine kinase [Micromonospora sediminimaris]|uniref:sensor histidine kinase n=1 Tax=Micromonospora sediminimaris TaxID=547162 RepID=UPI0037A90586